MKAVFSVFKLCVSIIVADYSVDLMYQLDLVLEENYRIVLKVVLTPFYLYCFEIGLGKNLI